MRRVIFEEYNQFREGREAFLSANIDPFEGIDKIMLFGMGGSALPGDLVSSYLEAMFRKGSIPPFLFQTFRSYDISPRSDEKTLHIVCSHSGNTEETLSVFDAVTKRNFPVIGISSGGALQKKCESLGLPFVQLPIPFKGFQPRMATGHFFSVLFHILESLQFLPQGMCDSLLKEEEALKDSIERKESIGKELASLFEQKTPIIYAGDDLAVLAMIWKIKINENAKTPAFWNRFPELNHNEMVGFTQPQADFSFLLLRDKEDDSRILKRYDVFERIMKEKGHSVKILDIEEKSMYSKVFVTLSLGDWTSYYLALRYGIDPTPVDMVEDFKKMLS
jgi:glucose/mannose-6-phosphate isomerase